jgi:ADP-heptose:LPS heptosyltransferase
MHIAAAVGTPVVLLLDKRAPETYLPLGDQHKNLYKNLVSEIDVEEVYEATRSVLIQGRTASLFAN